MKRFLFGLSCLLAYGCITAAPQALFVKRGDNYTKYNFGVAGDLKFSDNGHKLQISGYGDIIDLDNIDCISFNAPTGAGTLTPYAQKQKMITIGEAVNDLIDMKSVGDLLRMEDAFFNHHYSNGKTFHPAYEYDVPEEYWDVHKKVAGVMKAIGKIGNGNPSGVRSMRAKATELYKASDYFGVYVADQEKEEWVKTAEADYLEIQFKGYDGTGYSVRLDCSHIASQWENDDFRGEMPETMSLVFKVNSIKIADMTITSKLIQDESIDMNVDFNASGYRVNDVLAITNSLISDNLKVYVNGKESITATSTINGANLLKYDMMKDDIKESTHYHDENGDCQGEDPEALIAHFYRAQSDVDVLGMLQVKAKALDFSRLYDILAEELPDDIYNRGGYIVESMNSDKSVITVRYDEDEEIQQMKSIVSYLDNYADVQFFYDGKPEMQGFLSFELQDYTWENTYYDYTDWAYTIMDGRLKNVYKTEEGKWFYNYWGNNPTEVSQEDLLFPSKIRYVEYDEIYPRLLFPDMTSYAFEDFFDEGSFKDLINDYEEIINTYESITGQK